MKRFLSKYWQAGLTLAFALAVFLFWRFRYPAVLSYQEQLQLFLFDGDYFWERMAEPGGFARYVAEFLVQFYNSVTAGAAVISLLFMLVQRLTWRLMRSESHYALSFIPVMMLWYAMGDENVMLTYTVALALNMLMVCILAKVFLAWGYERRMLLRRLFVMLVVVPLAYWLTGPMVLLLAVVLMPVSVVYALALMLLSAHYLPFPMQRVMLGVSYYRIPATLPYLLMVLPAVVWIISNVVRLLPKASRVVNAVEVALAVGLLGVLADVGFDKKKYELIEYDYLVRAKDWNAIIAKAERRTPDLPMSVSATNLALGMTNQLGERAFDFYQRGAEGLLPGFERNFATTQLMGEIYFHLGMVNTAQRMAFEAMEAIPNYNKSARVMKRLAETNLINGQYEGARKDLRMLGKTNFFPPRAERPAAHHYRGHSYKEPPRRDHQDVRPARGGAQVPADAGEDHLLPPMGAAHHPEAGQ